MTRAQIEAGTLVASQDDRTVTGLLLKFGELGRTNLGRFSVQPGAFKLPKDVKSFLHLHDTHARPVKTVGTALFAQETDEGIIASWRINDGPDGDALLADLASDKPDVPRRLSIEVDDVQIRNGVAIGGVVHGAARVKQGAFPSATLLAADTEEEPPAPASTEPTTTTEKFSDEYVDEQGVKHKRTTTRTTTVDGDVTTIKETTVIEEPDAPAEEEPTVGNTATVPGTLVASHTKQDKTGPALSDVFDMITRAKAGEQSETLMAALTDIKTTGALGTGAPGGGAIQPSWLGELWQGRSYVRRYMPLIRNGSITAQDEKGFVINGTDQLVQPWAGNKTELPSGSAEVALLTSVFQRWGWAADIAREWFDIPANRPIIEAFLRRLANSYARQTDIWTGQRLTAAATLVAPEQYPAEYPNALGMLIQAIEAVGDSEDSASFAIVNPIAWKQLIYTPKDKLPEFISFDFGTGGEGTADGTVKVVKGATGITRTASVVAGSAASAHVNELPGAAPLNLDALDIARGGVDRAVIGYTQFMADYPAGLVKVGVPDPAA